MTTPPCFVPVEETFKLRQAVLRPTWTLKQVAENYPFPEGSFCVGVFTQGPDQRLVSTVTLAPEDNPVLLHEYPSKTQWKLWSMATDPDFQNRGIGSELIQFAIAHFRKMKPGRCSCIWLSGRVAAQRFYERLGFVTAGEVVITQPTGLPHVLFVLPIVSDASKL